MADTRLGSRQLAALLPDTADARPAYRHLAQAISALILEGRIALHTKLPAERELAPALKTSRATVTAAYDLLRESGYAHSRRGSGTFTALPESRLPGGGQSADGAAWTPRSTSLWRRTGCRRTCWRRRWPRRGRSW